MLATRVPFNLTWLTSVRSHALYADGFMNPSYAGWNPDYSAYLHQFIRAESSNMPPMVGLQMDKYAFKRFMNYLESLKIMPKPEPIDDPKPTAFLEQKRVFRHLSYLNSQYSVYYDVVPGADSMSLSKFAAFVFGELLGCFKARHVDEILTAPDAFGHLDWLRWLFNLYFSLPLAEHD